MLNKTPPPSSNQTCPRCSAQVDSRIRICPDCGLTLNFKNSDKDLFRRYFQTVWKITTQPTQYFKDISLSGGIAYPLAFALVTHWIGSSFQFMWNLAIGNAIKPFLSTWSHMAEGVLDVDQPSRTAQLVELQERITHWIWGAGSVVADPFITVFMILFTSIFVYAGAKLLVPSRNGVEVTYESAVRVICFGMAPALFSVFPFVGSIVAWIMIPIVTIIAAREVYRVTTTRGTIIALFPQLLLLGFVLLLLGFFAVAILKMITTVMGG